MKYIKSFIKEVKHFLNHLYYINTSITKNTFPLRLVAEKLCCTDESPMITFKVMGKSDIYDIRLNAILSNKDIIELFPQHDANIFGRLAFNDVVLKLPLNERKDKFEYIKNIMLNSFHDVTLHQTFNKSKIVNSLEENENNFSCILSFLKELPSQNNNFPYKFVGGYTNNKKSQTIIIYTIFGRRDGYEKPLCSIVNDPVIMNKFHPTEIVKLSFILMGDLLYSYDY